MFVLSRHHYPSFFVLFTPPSPSQVYTLSLHDALPILRSQLAATSRRLPFAESLPIVEGLLSHTEDLDDKQIPMLIWWTLEEIDRKSTRLNSSHVAISYAVFCLKKKTEAKYLSGILYCA